MVSNPIILILDLDGVLITTPSWKPDDIEKDNYSAFNPECVKNLNCLLELYQFEIWLSSTRRLHKSLERFNEIFSFRHIETLITGFVPNYPYCENRKEEVEQFIREKKHSKILILDDDKSLNDLEKSTKEKLVLTELTVGLNAIKLKEAIAIAELNNSI